MRCRGGRKDCSRNRLPDRILYECKITYTEPGMYHLHVPVDTPIEDNLNQEGFLGVDVGIRDAAKCFSPTGTVATFGSKDWIKTSIHHKLLEVDGWQSLRDKMMDDSDHLRSHILNHSKRKHLGRKQARIRRHVKETVRNLQWQAARWMCSRYRTVLVGELRTSEIIRKINRVFGRIPARILNQLSHYTWQRRMLEKAEETDCELRLVNERYTSKTCTRCGHIHRRLGGNKRYVCPNENCGLRIDRDVNAARNMLLMHLALLRAVLPSRNAEA